MTAIAPLPFVAAAIAMCVIALAFVVPSLWRRRSPRGASVQAANLEVQRSRLAELERERAIGALRDDEYAAAVADVQRSALREAGEACPPAPSSARLAAAVVAVALPLASIVLYQRFGEPTALESAAPAAGSASDPLVAHLARQPDDGRAWVLLARNEADAGRYADAVNAYEKAIALSPKIARDAGVWAELADALGMAGGGRLAGRPRELVERALALDPTHPRVLEMAGSAAYEARDFGTAARYWRELAQRITEPEARAELDAAIARADRLARTALPLRAEAPVRP
jgi:cytochrome c-type biogenesis protein CcmH